MTLVGREPVLAAARPLAESVLAGSGRLLLLAGEAGIGKTALLHELARAVPGARVLWGTCWAGGGAPAYWPWTQVLRGLGDAVDPVGP
ncbi:MAG: ATP-binding protein, partial [Pseudonocardia sp.]